MEIDIKDLMSRERERECHFVLFPASRNLWTREGFFGLGSLRSWEVVSESERVRVNY